jgi:hypothetical protein
VGRIAGGIRASLAGSLGSVDDAADAKARRVVITAAFVTDVKRSCAFFADKLGFAVAFMHANTSPPGSPAPTKLP